MWRIHNSNYYLPFVFIGFLFLYFVKIGKSKKIRKKKEEKALIEDVVAMVVVEKREIREWERERLEERNYERDMGHVEYDSI